MVGNTEAFKLAKNILGDEPQLLDVVLYQDAIVEAAVPTLLARAQMRPQLFDYQRDLAEKIDSLQEGANRALVSLPTGGGKTRTAVFGLLSVMSRLRSARVLWIAPTIELLDQAHSTLYAMWKVYGDAPDFVIERNTPSEDFSGVWFATPQAVNSYFAQTRNGGWDLVIFDEAHQVAAPTFRQSVDTVLASSDHCGLVGLSATPGRTDVNEIDDLLDIFGGKLLTSSTLGSHPVEYLQHRGVLARLDFKRVSNVEGLDPEQRLALAFQKAREIAHKGRKVLVFCRSLVEAEALAIALRSDGVPAEYIEGRLTDAERRSILGRFASGQTVVLTNQKLLTTGYDCPSVSDVILVNKVGSAILFEQMVGRAARGPRTGGSRRSTIWEFDDHLTLHGLPQSYYRYRGYDWL